MSRSAYASHDTLPGRRCEAIWVLMTSETCATDTAMLAGSICLTTRFTPGERQAARKFMWMRGNTAWRFSAGHCSASCSTPPTTTPTANA
ncbi:hypothetical protein GALL_481230 [mine drainage metagenome]|uniref:Uncharacterized protein n=1 Tax=mine drainage metagenome TaxID=410659 RepID=A0A1J5PRQ7_9ZZZZ